MKEDFLQIIWQMQCFSLPALSTEGHDIHVIRPGIRNFSDGPDFSNARIQMDGLEWNGSVEIHLRSGDWKQHGHHRDPAYESVILHVVWEEDLPVFRKDGSRIPALELKNRVSLDIILKYRELINNARETLPCGKFLQDMNPLIPESMLDHALAARLERKAAEMQKLFRENGFSRKRGLALMLARCLGMKGNEDAMERLLRSLPDVLLMAAGHSTDKMLAWFVGQSGLGFKAEEKELQKDYQLLKAAYRPEPLNLLWKKSGMRPGAFPLKRIGLLAALLPDLDKLVEMLYSNTEPEIESAGGWTKHPELKPGTFLHRHLMVNFLAPAFIIRSQESGQPEFSQLAMDMLHALKAEEHRLSKWLRESGFPMQTAGHSQGVVELHQNWCSRRQCMDCRIGTEILKNAGTI